MANNTALFGRKYALWIAPSIDSDTAFQYGNTTANTAPLRVSFDIKKDDKPAANPAHFVIYNLSTKTRSTIKPGWALRFQAGYKDTIQDLWIGQVGKGIASRNPDLSVGDKSSTKREGADISYAIESADGYGPLTFGTLDKSYSDGTPLSDVFEDIKKVLTTSSAATSFGITMGVLPDPLPLAKVRRSLVLHGNIRDALDALFKPIGYSWFVRDNQLFVVAINDHTKETIPFISQQTGLIGIPSKEDKGIVTIETLLNPQLAPGRLLQLKSADGSFDGYYRVNKVQHKGDTHGDDWKSEAQCIAYTGNPDEPIPEPSTD